MTIHSFCPTIADRYGVNEALLFRHICFCSGINPERWITKSVSEFAQAYPYLGRKALWTALQNICRGTRTEPALVRRSAVGQTFLYRPCLEEDTGRYHTFDADLAAEVGVLPAIVYSNIHFWIMTRWKVAVELKADKLDVGDYDFNIDLLNTDAYESTMPDAKYRLTTDAWAERHRYAPSRSIRRAFGVLVEKGYLRKTVDARHRPWWSLPKQKLVESQPNFISPSKLEESAAKRKRLRPKGNGCGQKETVAAKRKRLVFNPSTPVRSEVAF